LIWLNPSLSVCFVIDKTSEAEDDHRTDGHTFGVSVRVHHQVLFSLFDEMEKITDIKYAEI